MRILIAPTAFKGSFSPAQVGMAMLEGVNRFAETSKSTVATELLPLADGGDGTIEALHKACGGTLHKLCVPGALDEEREALWLEIGDKAIIEMASACGIAGLKNKELSPLKAHSRGLGQVISCVLKESRLRDLVIAVGGSASTDGGSGALYELGGKFFGTGGEKIVPAGGSSLLQIESCDLSSARHNSADRRLFVATDVSNPLLGQSGAAAIFGPQKGANPEELRILEKALARFAEVLEKESGLSRRNLAGSGAAGGTAFGLSAGLGAEIISGFDYISELVNLEKKVEAADLVISGEGRIDRSSMQGKVIGSLIEICKKHRKPICLFAGSVTGEMESGPNDSVQFFRLQNPANGKFADCNAIACGVSDLLSRLNS